MGPPIADTAIQSLVESFTSELARLVTSSVLSEAEQALGGPPAAVRARPASRAETAPGVLTPVPRQRLPGPVSFERYERMAIERALAECSGSAQAAARLLGVGKSTFYRQMKQFGIAPGTTALTEAVQNIPLSLDAYERMALEHALKEAGGDKFAA